MLPYPIQDVDDYFGTTDLPLLLKALGARKQVTRCVLGMVMAPLRIALVGSLRGPNVFDICSAIGINNCVERINALLKHVS